MWYNCVKARAKSGLFYWRNMPNINGTKQLGDFEYQKFREDSAGKPAIAVVNADGSNISTGMATAINQDQITGLIDDLVIKVQALVASSPSLQVTDGIQRLRTVVDSISGTSLGVSVGAGQTMGVPSTIPTLSTGTTYFQGVYPIGQSWQQNTQDLQNISFNQSTDRISITE